MDCYTPQSNRRHNPVDSICRKLQTIQWRGDREPNSPFQIPKISSSNYDSPSCGLRHNLEAVLKKGALHKEQVDRRIDKVTEKGKARVTATPSSAGSQRSGPGPSAPPSVPSTPACDPPTPVNVTYTITSTLGERRGAEGSDVKQLRTWQRYCSTPTAQAKDSPYFTFTRGPQSESEEKTRSPLLSRTFTPSHNSMSYNLNFCSSDATTNPMECDLPYPALVVKRLSMGDGVSMASERKKENMAEISLICEENLLDTIFHACDTQRRGKVYVSHIVDYLRHTTSRSSGDSGLDELCNMLDPEHKDVSIDLDTYHAVMREWIDDCRSVSDEQTDSTTQDSVKLKECLSARRSLLLNMTSGSLEAFGGEASRVEFETSELVYCVADLQMCNQKLEEEVRKLKQVVEGMEDANQKLAEENEELRNQARVHQQLAQKEKLLKEEVEEMKATLSCTEEGRARASAHSKNVEKENQELIAKIASLQEENFKVSVETEDLQRRITELCDTNADLQVQIHSFDSVVNDKETVVQEKSRQIRELKAAMEEYSSVIELLRADKNKLESQMQLIHPDLVGAGLSLSLAYRLNQSSSGSLQTELALAQSPLEVSHVMDHLSTNMNITSPLDETLDREVFLLMQGPSPDHMALEFKSLLNKLKRNFTDEANSVISTMRTLLDEHESSSDRATNVQAVQAELDARRSDWAVSLDQLAQYTDSLEKELIKMASNMRRSRTEILHLSVRVQEQENQKRQLCEELEQLKTPQDSREASCQTPAPDEEPAEEDLVWEDEGELLLQDFLSNDLDKCRRPESRDGGGRDRDTSTPMSVVCMDTQPGADSAVFLQPQLQAKSQLLQENTVVPSSTHSQAVSVRHPEADALCDPSHSENNSASDCFANNLSDTQEREHAATTGNSPTKPPTMVALHGPSTGPGEDTPCDESAKLLSQELTGEEEKKSGVDVKTGDMNSIKSLKQDQLADRAAAAVEDSVSLLPVLVEEEESVQESSAKVPAGEANMAASDRLGVVNVSGGSSPSSGPLLTISSRLESGRAGVTSDPSQSTKREGGKNKKELDLTGGVEVAEDHKIQEDHTARTTNRRHSDTSMMSDSSDVFKEDSNSLTPTDKEIEAEFQRLALGFKCDMFTLEKRLRLEERSRDLAEENVRREVSSCQGLLQALIPLCEDDTQSMEIIQRLQKNLDILIQSMTRVSSRSEMLGAIHQENRIGKAVEVMIQHVENLKRMYTKEHAELLELRQTMLQNERSFGSQTEKDDFRGKKQTASQYYKSTARRVSIAAIPRSGGSNMFFDLSKPQDLSDADTERLTRRSPWNMTGKNMARPPLKRFVSSAAWVDTEEPSVMMKGNGRDATDCQSEDEQTEEPVADRRKSSLNELGNIISSFILPLKTPSPSSSPTSADPGIVQSLSQSLMSSRAAAAAVARGSRGLWLWLALLLVLAGLLALLASLVMQPVVDAAPVGTGDSWMTIQQLLWPYTGLRHNGQPPV